MIPRKTFVFILFCCCLLTLPFFLSGPAVAADSETATITAKVILVCYDITVTGIDTSHATISWKTNGDANSTVGYGTTTGYGSFSTNGVMGKDHTITISGLSPSRVYHFHVISADLAGNRVISNDFTFTTTAGPTVSPTPTSSAPVPTSSPSPTQGTSDGGNDIDSFEWPPWSLHQISHFGEVQPTVLPVLPQPSARPVQPQQPSCENEVFGNYTAGFRGLLFHADGNNTLDLDISEARSAGAAITIEPDHIDAYPPGLPGGVVQFRRDTSAGANPAEIGNNVTGAELWTGALVGNFTTGRFSGSLHAVPARILPRSAINIALTTCIPEPVSEKVRLLSSQNNLTLKDIPCMMNVTTIDLAGTAPAEVTMTLPASWVDLQGGSGSVHIARISGESEPSALLTTVFTGRDSDGGMSFRGDTTHETGLFVIFSTERTDPQNPAQPGQNNQTVTSAWFYNPLFMGAVLIILLILALILIALYSRQRQQKKA